MCSTVYNTYNVQYVFCSRYTSTADETWHLLKTTDALSGHPNPRSGLRRSFVFIVSYKTLYNIIVTLTRSHFVYSMILYFSFTHYLKNMYTFRDNECLPLKESLCIRIPLSHSTLPPPHTHALCIHGLRSDSCRADFHGRARSPSKSKYKQHTAAGRRGASRKSARLINTVRHDGTSSLFARYRRSCQSAFFESSFLRFSSWLRASPTTYPPQLFYNF
jgi:hypothetical protein